MDHSGLQGQFNHAVSGNKQPQMPPYKNQHYLPVAYLKEFTSDKSRTGRNALIWRFDGTRSLNVPVESQCVEAYHYSRDRAVLAESIFAGMEGAYSKSVKRL